MYFHDVARALTEAQLEFDVLPIDYLLKSESDKGKLSVNSCRFESVIVPFSEYLSEEVLKKLSSLASEGVKIIWVGEKTTKTAEGGSFVSDFGAVSKLSELGRYIRENVGCDISLSSPFRHLRFCHRTDGEADVYMLFNESVDETFEGKIDFSAKGEMLVYDAYENTLFTCPDGKFRLEPYESRFVIFGANIKGKAPVTAEKKCTPGICWSFEVCGDKHTELFNIAKKYTRFGGKVVYTAEFAGNKDAKILDLGYVGETATVKLNGKILGTRIAPPYRFDVSGLLSDQNSLEVEVITHLGYARRDEFSSYLGMEPLGLLGPVELFK